MNKNVLILSSSPRKGGNSDPLCGQMKTLIDRTCPRYTEISGKEFYFIVTAADSNLPAMKRTIEGFRGFTSCLEGATEKGIIYGTGAWKAGEIKGEKGHDPGI